MSNATSVAEGAAPIQAAKTSAGVKISAWVETTKPRIATLLLLMAVASYFLALRQGGAFSWYGLMSVVVVVVVLSMGIFPLNHWMERDRDQLMLRTRSRPLPAKILRPKAVLAFGLVCSFASFALAWLLAGWLTAAIAVFVAVSYLLLYTPLKYRTAYHTSVGALSGATPPLIGWSIAIGSLSPDAWVLTALMFFWQFPHFLSIDLIYRDDYAKAGIKVLPVVDQSGRATAIQVIGATVLLTGVSIVPVFTGLAHPAYGIIAGLLGLVFLYFGVRAVTSRQKMAAKHLLRASVLYLPLVFITLLINF